jgi:hypothetical protein
MGQLLMEHVHGAVVRIHISDMAFRHRAEGYNMLVLSEWTDPQQIEAAPLSTEGLCRAAPYTARAAT